MIEAEQFEADLQPGYQFCLLLPQMVDGILGVVLQSTTSVNAAIQGLRIRLEQCPPLERGWSRPNSGWR